MQYPLPPEQRGRTGRGRVGGQRVAENLDDYVKRVLAETAETEQLEACKADPPEWRDYCRGGNHEAHAARVLFHATPGNAILEIEEVEPIELPDPEQRKRSGALAFHRRQHVAFMRNRHLLDEHHV